MLKSYFLYLHFWSQPQIWMRKKTANKILEKKKLYCFEKIIFSRILSAIFSLDNIWGPENEDGSYVLKYEVDRRWRIDWCVAFICGGNAANGCLGQKKAAMIRINLSIAKLYISPPCRRHFQQLVIWKQ